MENDARVSKTRKGQKPMKKIFFDLQLFAEEAAAETETGSGTETTTEQTTEQSTEQKQDGKADEKKYSDADFDKKLNQKFAEWQRKKEQEIAEAEKLAKMNAEEKANHNAQKEKERADKAEARIAELERKDALTEMSKAARKMLADEGINISDELLSVIVTPEAKSTQTNVKNFVTLFKAEVEKGIKAQATGTTPKIIQNNSEGLSEIEKRIAKYN